PELPLALDRTAARPLFLQIARAIVDEICRGRLKPGDILPGTRTLARTLGVNRITVLTAYDELPEPDLRRRTRPAPRATLPSGAAYDLSPAPAVEYAPESLADGLLVFG